MSADLQQRLDEIRNEAIAILAIYLTAESVESSDRPEHRPMAQPRSFGSDDRAARSAHLSRGQVRHGFRPGPGPAHRSAAAGLAQAPVAPGLTRRVADKQGGAYLSR